MIVLGRKPGGAGGGGGPPTGAAGGDLGGTYPDPTLSVAKQAELDGKIPKSLIDAKGDLVAATAADTPARLAVGATNGMVLEVASAAATGMQWDLPPGHQFDYAEITSNNAGINATVEASATTIITGNAVTYDGSTAVVVEFFFPAHQGTTTTADVLYVLFDGTSPIYTLARTGFSVANDARLGGTFKVRFTPSAASHTYSVRGYNAAAQTVTLFAGGGGAGQFVPAFMRIVKA